MIQRILLGNFLIKKTEINLQEIYRVLKMEVNIPTSSHITGNEGDDGGGGGRLIKNDEYGGDNDEEIESSELAVKKYNEGDDSIQKEKFCLKKWSICHIGSDLIDHSMLSKYLYGQWSHKTPK